MQKLKKLKCLYDSKKVLIDNFISLAILQGVNYILPLITVPYLTRVLGPSKYGLVGFANAFINYFVIITDYGFNLSATKEISINRENSTKVSRIFSSVMIIKLIFMLLSYLIMFMLVISIEKFKTNYMIYVITFGIVVGNVLFPVWLFQGLENMKYITILNLGAKIATTILTFILVTNQSKYITLIALNSLSVVIIGIISLFIVFNKMNIKFVVPTIKEIKRQLLEGWYIFISSLSIVMYTSSTTFILGLFTNDVTVGYFIGADKIRMAIQGLLTPVFQTLYPHINKIAQDSRQKVIKFIKNEVIYIGLITILMSLVTMLFSPILVKVLLSKQYLDSIPILQVFAFNPIFVALSNILTIQCMLSFNLKKQYSRIYITSSLIGIVLMLLLTYYYSAIGTAYSILFIEALVVILTIYSLKKNNILT